MTDEKPLAECDDAALLRAFTDPATSGAAYNAIYFRHREGVRAALERNGLSPWEAEVRVGAVFDRALGVTGAGQLAGSLDEALAEAARTLASPASPAGQTAADDES